MPAPHPDIADLIPHQGTMCLLEGIISWDQHHIVCRAVGHRRPDNPLRGPGGLPALCGIEYGAQAMAAHAAILDPPCSDRPAPGVLVSIRDVKTGVARLDQLEGDLSVCATLITAHGQGRIYDLVITSGEWTVLTGRVAVMRTAEADPEIEDSPPPERTVL